MNIERVSEVLVYEFGIARVRWWYEFQVVWY